jgi:hypothetical protein
MNSPPITHISYAKLNGFPQGFVPTTNIKKRPGISQNTEGYDSKVSTLRVPLNVPRLLRWSKPSVTLYISLDFGSDVYKLRFFLPMSLKELSCSLGLSGPLHSERKLSSYFILSICMVAQVPRMCRVTRNLSKDWKPYVQICVYQLTKWRG